MKKFLIVIVSLFVLSVLGALVLSLMEPKVRIADYDTVVEKLENEETFIFVLGQEGCRICESYTEGTLKEYLGEEEGLDLVYFDIYRTPETSFQDFLKEYPVPNYQGTPTTYIVINGEFHEEYRLVGDASLPTLKSLIQKALIEN